MSSRGPVWKVQGGGAAGGIIVRINAQPDALQICRLATGSLIEELQREGTRIKYRRLSGRGPPSGWVQTKLKDKDLLQEIDGRVVQDACRSQDMQAAVDADMCMPLELVEEVSIGELRGLVRRPQLQGARAPCAVVIAPGNPGINFGSAHAGSPLMVALEAAFATAGVPCLRFDYQGIGMSAPEAARDDPKKWELREPAEDSVVAAVAWAREHLADEIVVCGYSMGASMSLDVAVRGDVAAYIALSMGYKVFMFFPEEEQEEHKKGMEVHSKICCPALYLVGSRDRMTPLAEVERLTAARSDGGSGSTVEVIADGKHAFETKEDDVAKSCADWLCKLRRDIVEGDALALLLTKSLQSGYPTAAEGA